MTAVTASAWVADRLSRAGREAPGVSRAGREASAVRGGRGGDPVRRRLAGHPVRPVGGSRLTLEQRLDSVWEGLRADGTADCPVCHGRMEGFGPARCRDCGSELA